MSGDSEAPPTYYFSGITFNPSFYQSASDYLTKTTAKNYFLTYPIAQGDETINRIYTSQISTLTPTENFNFLDSQTASIFIGENVTGTANQVIQIGAPALTTVKCGALAIKDTKINNALNATGGSIYIGDQQTNGDVYIGSGSSILRTAGSNINIGNYSTSVGTINIGTSGTTTNINGKGSIYATKFDIHDTTAVLQLGDLQTTGRLDIGSGGSRSGTGAINIGTGGSALFSITIGSSTSTTTLAGTSVSVSTKLVTPIVDTAADGTDLFLGSNIVGGQIKMGGSIVNGSVFICNGDQFSGAINIGNASTTATNIINLGNANTTVKILNKLVIPTIDTGTTSTTLKLGSNIQTGNIEIGGALTSGDIIIGNNNTTGATITVGKSLTQTTINGSVILPSGGNNGTTGILSGKNGYGQGGAVTMNATTMNSEYLYIITGSTSVTITLPSTATEYQIISIRSIVNNVGTGFTNTITAGGTVQIWPVGSNFATTYTLPVFGAIKLIYIGGTYYQIP